MDPVAFIIPIPFEGLSDIEIRWYGITMAAAMVLGAFISARLLKAQGRNGEVVWDGLFWLIIAGVIGARLVYVLTNASLFFGPDIPLWHVIAVWHGGLSFHGGIIAGMIAAYIFFSKAGIPFTEVMDSFAPGVGLGIILVRFGNFMNGDILGYEWDGPWAMNFPYDPLHNYGAIDQVILRHPAEIYGMLVGLFCLALSVVLWNETYKSQRLPKGSAFIGFIFSYSLVRSVIEEPFRSVPLWPSGNPLVDPAQAGYGLATMTQIVSVFLIIISLWCFTQLRKWEKAQVNKRSVQVKAASQSRQARRAAERETRKRNS
jgi:phosphatidylglycerol:prolipoprotein diacylglycerol transferase